MPQVQQESFHLVPVGNWVLGAQMHGGSQLSEESFQNTDINKLLCKFSLTLW